MKVCTDGCIQGAYAGNWITKPHPKNNFSPPKILDIGTGTGLLTLMLAQKIYASFDAVELDKDSYLQAKNNFVHSPWSNHISIHYGDIRTFDPGKRYDFIICNPPFYENEMKSPELPINLSRHSYALTHPELAQSIKALLMDRGVCCIMLPEKQFDRFCSTLEKVDLFPQHFLKIRQTPRHSYFRIIGFFEKMKVSPTSCDLIICDENGKYTSDFKNLLKDYYLYLDA